MNQFKPIINQEMPRNAKNQLMQTITFLRSPHGTPSAPNSREKNFVVCYLTLQVGSCLLVLFAGIVSSRHGEEPG